MLKWVLCLIIWEALLTLVILRPPRFLKKYLNPDPDYEGVIREINNVRVAKDFSAKKLHDWQKERGV